MIEDTAAIKKANEATPKTPIAEKAPAASKKVAVAAPVATPTAPFAEKHN